MCLAGTYINLFHSHPNLRLIHSFRNIYWALNCASECLGHEMLPSFLELTFQQVEVREGHTAGQGWGRGLGFKPVSRSLSRPPGLPGSSSVRWGFVEPSGRACSVARVGLFQGAACYHVGVA